MVRDFVLSLIRTYSPGVVIGVATWLTLALDVEFTEDITTGLTAFVVLTLSGLYYLIARLLESKWPWLSFLLGTPKDVSTPTYSNTKTIPGEVVDDDGVAR